MTEGDDWDWIPVYFNEDNAVIDRVMAVIRAAADHNRDVVRYGKSPLDYALDRLKACRPASERKGGE